MKTFSQEQIDKTEKVKEILTKVLPSQTFINVYPSFTFYGTEEIVIKFSVGQKLINDVKGQYVQMNSLLWDLKTKELSVQIYGGNGGQNIWIIPQKNKYLAMERVKVPFRKPKEEDKFIFAAIERFAQNWLKALKENRNILFHQNLVDYDEFLNS